MEENYVDYPGNMPKWFFKANDVLALHLNNSGPVLKQFSTMFQARYWIIDCLFKEIQSDHCTEDFFYSRSNVPDKLKWDYYFARFIVKKAWTNETPRKNAHV